MKEEFLLYHYSLLLRCTVGLKGEEGKSHCAYITPLAYHFGPSTNESIDIYSIKDHFMFGDALLVAPVITHSQKVKPIYLPDETFYYFRNGRKADFSDKEVYEQIYLDTIPIYFRAGYTIPMVQPGNTSRVDLHISLKTIRNNGIEEYSSNGILVLDDGESLHSYISSMMFYITINVTGHKDQMLTVDINTYKPKYVTSQFLYLNKYTNYGDIYLYGYSISTEESKKINVIVNNRHKTEKLFEQVEVVDEKIKISNINIPV